MNPIRNIGYTYPSRNAYNDGPNAKFLLHHPLAQFSATSFDSQESICPGIRCTSEEMARSDDIIHQVTPDGDIDTSTISKNPSADYNTELLMIPDLTSSTTSFILPPRTSPRYSLHDVNDNFSPVKYEENLPLQSFSEFNYSNKLTNDYSNNYRNKNDSHNDNSSDTEEIQATYIPLRPTRMVTLDTSWDIPHSSQNKQNRFTVVPSIYSIWKGNLWSVVNFMINIPQTFMATEGEKFCGFSLRALIRNTKTGIDYDGLSNKVQFSFGDSACKPSYHEISTTTEKIRLRLKVHQDLFEGGDEFVLIIEVFQDSNHKDRVDTIQTLPIRCMENAFVIEPKFVRNNPFIHRTHGKSFVWFNKSGGENATIDVTIHKRNSRGEEIIDQEIISVQTELVYEDLSPTPSMPLLPLKERRSNCKSENPLFRRMRSDPVFYQNESAKDFSFRIEEVSKHHCNQNGFKLKVKSLDSNKYHPGFLAESIIVKSKPKKDEQLINDKSEGGRIEFEENELEPVKKKRKKSSEKKEESLLTRVPYSALVNTLLTETRKCSFCGSPLSDETIFIDSYHDEICPVTRALPFLQFSA